MANTWEVNKMVKKLVGIFLASMLVLVGTIGVASPSTMRSYAYADNETRYFDMEARGTGGGDSFIGMLHETIPFSHRQVTMFVQNPALPGYGSSLGCGVVAGGNIVAWYNRTLPGLIPNHVAGQYF